MNTRGFFEGQRELIFIAALAAVSSWLFFYNLGGRLLWQDEAQTALVAKTVLANGIPMVSDGTNSFSQEMGAEAGPDGIYKWHPWLSFYLAAISMKIFGINTFGAKFPFALTGLLTVLAAFSFAKEVSGSFRAAAIAGILLALSPAFLVLAKQCRYYGPVMLFTLVALREYALLYGGKIKSAAGLVVSAVCLYYSQNVNFGILAAVFLAHAAVFKRALLPKLAAAMAFALIFCLPWAFYTRDMPYKRVYPNIMTVRYFFAAVPAYAALINAFVFPVVLLLIPVLLRTLGKDFFNAAKYGGRAALMGFFVFFYIAFISFFSVSVFYRYLAGLVPLGAVATGIIFDELMTLEFKAVKWAVISAIMVMSSQVVNYVREITTPYNGPVKGMVEFLEKNASPGDIVAITYEDLPVKFYTGLKIIGGLEGGDLTPAKNAKWVIIRKYAINGTQPFCSYLEENLDLKKFRKIKLGSPDNMFENRENPEWHLFETVKNEDPVVVLERPGPVN